MWSPNDSIRIASADPSSVDSTSIPRWLIVPGSLRLRFFLTDTEPTVTVSVQKRGTQMENFVILAKLYNDGALREAYSAMPNAPTVEVTDRSSRRRSRIRRSRIRRVLARIATHPREAFVESPVDAC